MFEAIHRWFEHVIGNDMVKVKSGDSLWRIAENVTGNGSRWQELADANPDKHWNKDYVVQIGEQLKLPESWL